MKATGYSAVTAPLLIFGGGYDTCEDGDPNTCSTDLTPKGNRIYVLDADTGAVVTSFNTERSVTADVFVITDDVTGRAMWAYAADLGGNIYRISGVDANTPIEPTRLRPTGRSPRSPRSAAPRSQPAARQSQIHVRPDVVENWTAATLIRSAPATGKSRCLGFTGAYGVTNYFFMIIGPADDDEWLTDENAACSVDLICLDSLLRSVAWIPTPTTCWRTPRAGTWR